MVNELDNHNPTPSLSYYGWFIWTIAALFYAYEFIHRVSISVMVPDLMISFDVLRAPLGDMAAYYFYAYALVQVPAGMLIDRYGVRSMLTIACLLVALGSFLLNTANTLPFACMSRFIIGAGSAFGFVGCLKIIATWIAPKYFPLMVGMTNLFGVMGAIVGGEPLAASLNVLSWREVYLALGIVGMIIGALLWIFVKDKDTGSTPSEEPRELILGIKHVVQSPQVWFLSLYCMMIVAPITAFAEMWGVEFFKTSYSLQKEQAAGFLRYIFLGIAFGGPIIGWLNSYLQNIKIWLIASCLIILITLISVIYMRELTPNQLRSILFIYGFASSHMLLCFSIANQVFPQWAQGAAIGFINMMIMGGSAVFQPLIGKLIDIKLGNMPSPIYEDVTYAQFSSALSVLPLCIIIAVSLTVFIRTRHK